jgi:hypothetical protein
MTAKATINMLKNKSLPIFIISIAVIALFVFSFMSYVISKDSHRRTFVFPSAENGKYIIEYRNLAEKPHQGDLQLYVEELLLGSTVERTKMLFTPGTRVISCFERKHVLYLNLTNDLLSMGDGVVEIREGTELLIKNIKDNFSEIDQVELFIDGKSAFEK